MRPVWQALLGLLVIYGVAALMGIGIVFGLFAVLPIDRDDDCLAEILGLAVGTLVAVLATVIWFLWWL